MTPEEHIGLALRALPTPPWAGSRPRRSCRRHAASSRRSSSASSAMREFRERAIADLEAMLRSEGVEPTPVVVAHLRRRLET